MYLLGVGRGGPPTLLDALLIKFGETVCVVTKSGFGHPIFWVRYCVSPPTLTPDFSVACYVKGLVSRPSSDPDGGAVVYDQGKPE